MSNYVLTSNGELYHYGVKGQKWGKRKWPLKNLQDPKRLKARVDAHGAAGATVGSISRHIGRSIGKTALAYLTFGLAAGELEKRGRPVASNVVSKIGDITLAGAIITDAVKTGKEIVDIQMYNHSNKKKK